MSSVECIGTVEDLFDLQRYLIKSQIPIKYIKSINEENLIIVYFTTIQNSTVINITRGLVDQYIINVIKYIEVGGIIDTTNITIGDYTEIDQDMRGNKFISIKTATRYAPNFSGFISKNISDKLPSIFKIVGYTSELDIKWDALNSLEVSGGNNNLYALETRDNTIKPVELLGTSSSLITSRLQGCEIIMVDNVVGGCVGTFAICKNSNTILPNIIRLTSSNPVADYRLGLSWDISSGIYISKNHIEYDGDYLVKSLSSVVLYEEYITLNGIDQTVLLRQYTKYSGIIIIENTITNAPCGIFSITKNRTSHSANINTLVSMRGNSSNEKLQITYDINNIYINKNGVNYNGIYRVILL